MKNKLILGTLFLTLSGLTTRVIGFFYRIFLSNALGAKTLGVYQLIFPVYGICFTIFASGIQTALSKLIAEAESLRDTKRSHRYFLDAVLLSVGSALLLSVLLFFGSGIVAKHYLKEIACTESLRLLSLAFPFCGITSCVHGYCYGIKRAFIPATSQLAEQSVRVCFLFTISALLPVTCELAIIALLAGEIFSCLYCITGTVILKHKMQDGARPLPSEKSGRSLADMKSLLRISLPLTSNRLFINVLHSFETFIVPLTLRRFGLSRDDALSIFGILTGMTMSFLMFPGTLTNSLSVLLLPAISEADAQQNRARLSHAVSVSVKYSVLLGLSAGFLFFFFGEELGTVVFSEKRAGTYLACLSFLCPFLYVSTTFSSILNGLGRMNLTFLSSVIGLSMRVILFGVLIPRYSVYGYFISLMTSQLFMNLFDLALIRRTVPFTFNAVSSIVTPSIILLATASFFFRAYEFLCARTTLHHLLLLVICCFLMALVSLILFAVTGIIRRSELQA